MPSRVDSPYSRLNYRRLIAWPQRIEREWPFLESQIARAPERSVVDLGCGTGEHARHLASKGVRTTGVDRAEDQIAKARDFESEFSTGPIFVQGDLTELGRLELGRFGLALCLGNVVPHLEDDLLELMLRETASILLPGGRLVMQLINYERILGQKVRSLPVNVRSNPDGSGDIAFVRLLRPDSEDERYIWFYPTTLVLDPGADRPVEVEATKEVRLRAWQRNELEPILGATGFAIEAIYGNMTGGPYDALNSQDLVVAATRQGA